MKQKIFSLLVLMITTVCGAWAQDVETFRVQLSVNCSALNVENGLFFGTEFSKSQLLGGIMISEFDLEENYFHVEKGLEVEISQIESPSYPSGFSYDGSDFLIWMSVNQKFTGPVNLPIDVYYNEVHYEGTVTVSVYHNTHSYSSTTWEKDETYHWHQCNNEYGMCNPDASKIDLATHTYSSGFCIDCDQPEPGHTHSFSTDWIKTATHHFHPCTASSDCPLASAHGFNDPLESPEFTEAWSNLDELQAIAFAYGLHGDSNPVDGNCDACGYHMHLFSADWTLTATHHYHKCVGENCPLNSDNLTADVVAAAGLTELASVALAFAAHADTEEPIDGKCDACGYVMTPAHEHHVGSTWTLDADHRDYHYLPCTAEGCFITDYNAFHAAEVSPANIFSYEGHQYENADASVCLKCNYDRGAGHVHELATDYVQALEYHYKKCTIDNCPLNSTTLTKDLLDDLDATLKTMIGYAAHTDGNTDETCDVCGAAIHHHVADTKYIQIEGGTYHYTKCTTDGCTYNSETLTAADFTDAAVAAALNFGKHADFLTYYNACEKCGYHTVHTPEEYWVTNGGNHYHPCMAVGCPLSSVYLTGEEAALDDDAKTALSFGAHFDVNQDNKCDVCEKDLNAHEHFFTSDWTTTDTTHYHKCIAQGCDLEYTAAGLAEQSVDVKTAVAFGQHTFEGNVCSVCGYEKHIHHFADEWTKTAESHYHKCLLQGCNLTATDYKEGTNMTETEKTAVAYAEHSFDTNNVCTTCGYDKNAAHVHVFGDTWYEMTVDNKQYHYKKCTAADCPINYENMSDLEKAITSYGQHQYGTSQEGAAYYTCKVCGKVNEARQAEEHEHSYQYVSIASTDETDAFEHWQECVATEGACSAPKVYPAENKKKHQFDGDATDYTYYTCSICRYIDEERKAHAPHVHVFAEAWSNNETHHYHECIGTQGECTLKYDGTDNEALEKYAEHTYGGSQEGAKYYTCKTCGYINTTRKNADHSHDYGAWKHDNLQHWKECTAADNGTELAGPCTEPKGSLGNHEYASTDDAATPEDERALCSVCGWYNEARKQAIDNAAAAANVQSWCWDYEIPFNFEATVQNDRRFNADQCYTIFLPYALELNGLKAYAIEQHNDNIVGFKEQAVTELPQLTPFVVKSETTGNPLSSAMTTVYATLQSSDNAAWMTADEKAALISDRGYANSQASIHSTGGRLYMLGTLRYLVGDGANGRYIMQGKDAHHPNGVFKLISGTTSDNAGYDKVDNRACILPMRAHIETLGGDARQTFDIVFYAADGSTTTVKGLVIDEDASLEIYDLQGRRVQNPRKGGLYIINGKKTILK